jgi:hypothetical protein
MIDVLSDYHPGGAPEGGLQRTLSTASLESVLPPPLRHKRRVIILLFILSIATVAQIAICCLYSDITGSRIQSTEHIVLSDRRI